MAAVNARRATKPGCGSKRTVRTVNEEGSHFLHRLLPLRYAAATKTLVVCLRRCAALFQLDVASAVLALAAGIPSH